MHYLIGFVVFVIAGVIGSYTCFDFQSKRFWFVFSVSCLGMVAALIAGGAWTIVGLLIAGLAIGILRRYPRKSYIFPRKNK